MMVDEIERAALLRSWLFRLPEERIGPAATC
jgi:hypothetical protein